MRVICPRCESRCAETDVYCPTCGSLLSGAPQEPESDTSSVRAMSESQHDGSRRTSPEPTAEVPAPTWNAPPAGSNASTEADSDFIPLRFETPREDWRGGGHRWMLLLLGLLSVGTAVALLWDGNDEPDAPADVPAIVDEPVLATPTATGLQVVVASPVPTTDGSSEQARTPATPATPVQAGGAATPSAAVDRETAAQSVDTTSIAGAARLQTSALTGLAGARGRSTPVERAGEGDPTAIEDSELPLIGPPDREEASEPAGD
jgi:hypothetical protein